MFSLVQERGSLDAGKMKHAGTLHFRPRTCLPRRGEQYWTSSHHLRAYDENAILELPGRRVSPRPPTLCFGIFEVARLFAGHSEKIENDRGRRDLREVAAVRARKILLHSSPQQLPRQTIAMPSSS